MLDADDLDELERHAASLDVSLTSVGDARREAQSAAARLLLVEADLRYRADRLRQMAAEGRAAQRNAHRLTDAQKIARLPAGAREVAAALRGEIAMADAAANEGGE